MQRMLAVMLNMEPSSASTYCSEELPSEFHLGHENTQPYLNLPMQSASASASTASIAPQPLIPGLRPDAFCSRTNPSVILRDDDFDAEHAVVQHVRDAFMHFDELMTGPNQQKGGAADAYNDKHHYMANAARFKARELMLMAEALEYEADNNPTLSEVHHMRRAWLVGRIDRAMNLCWYERHG